MGEPLIVDQFGAFLGKHSERLRVTVKGELVAERPLFDLDHVLITGRGVALSVDAIAECTERGIPISLIAPSGQPVAALYAPALVGTVQTRRQQLAAYEDGRGVALAKAFVLGKLGNQAALLKYMAKYRRARDFDVFDGAREAALRIEGAMAEVRALPGGRVDDVRGALLTLEAHAAQRYWEAARLLVAADGWERRETRGATDLVNSLLNYGYGILYSQVERAVVLAGLDPYGGFLHVDRPGKPSLALDLIEEFRQTVVDRSVFALLNQRVRLALDAEGRLDDATRRAVAERVLARLEAAEPYERGQKRTLRTVLQAQARRIAAYVRGEGTYRPFVARW